MAARRDQPAPGRPLIHDPILLGLLAIAAVATLWYVLVPAGTAAHVIVYRTLQPLLNVAMVVLSVRAARLPTLPRAARRFWYSLALAGSFFSVGNGFQAVATWPHPTAAMVPMGAFQSVCQVLGTACPLIMMLSYPLGLDSRRKRVSFWLDAVTVMIATAVVAWYLSVGTALDGRQLVASLISCGISVVAVFAVVKLLISGSRPFTRAAAFAGAASVGIEGVTEAVGPLLSRSGYLNLLLAASLVPAYLSTATPRVQELRMLADPAALNRPARLYSRLPYLAVAVTQAVLVAALVRRGPDSQMWGVMAGVLVITAAVVARQLTAFTDNSRLLREASRQEQRFRALVRHASEITFIVDAAGTISYASPATNRVLGVDPEQTVTRPWGWNVHADDLDTLRLTMADLLCSPGSSVTYQIRVTHADGTWRWLEIVSTNLIEDPSVGGIVCNARDVSAAHRFQEKLRHEASHDPLTGLGNRGLFDARLTAHRDQQTAIILIDLDDFKPVNDNLGHHVGDALLVAVGQRLQAVMRPTDTVVRLGGDEFAVLLPGATADAGAAVADRIRQALTEPVHSDGHRLTIRASMGVAAGELDRHGHLLRRADEAMYAAKRAGKGAVARS
jgi:diguanylate cyclase (GGDEF)-like protein/PAS domain S-box-containing protein